MISQQTQKWLQLMDQLITDFLLMEIILTIVNENYYFYWTDSVFLNGWLTVSGAANCLTDLVECFSDSVIV